MWASDAERVLVEEPLDVRLEGPVSTRRRGGCVGVGGGI
jgi:hypothetical protein